MGYPDDVYAPPSQDGNNASAMSQLDDIIDLITNKYITCDLGGQMSGDSFGVTRHYLYENDMDPWEWLITVNGGYDGSAQEAREFYLSTNAATETADDQVIIQRHGAAFDTPDVFVKHKGARWTEIRSWFEGIKMPYETALSFQQNGFIGPEIRLGFAVDDLVPIGDISDSDVDELSQIDVTAVGDEPSISDDLEDRLNGNDNWSDARTADRFLEGWQGRGAQVFKWAYLERRPSILVGQAMTAKALHQSVEILDDSYRNVRTESYGRMWDAEEIFEMYPHHNPSDNGGIGWGGILEKVAGVAGLVGAGASLVAWHPAGATVGSIARIIGGGATLAGAVVNSAGHEEQVANEVKIEGDSISEIYDNWYAQIQAFINTVLNMETVIGENLTALKTRIEESRSNSGASLETTFGDTVELTDYQSFFAPKAPGEGSFTPGTTDGLGPATPNGDNGAAFAGDLNELFKVAVNHMPALADVYGRQAGRSADDGMSAATQRTIYETAPYSGGSSYAADSNGAALQPWLDLHGAFEEMMTTSETNFRAAGDSLRTAAIHFRDSDAAAATGIDQVYQDLEP